MAKKPQAGAPSSADDSDRLLIDLASALLAEYFFDPDNEAQFLETYPSRKASPGNAPLVDDTMESGSGELHWRLEVLGQRNAFRVTMRHPAFTAVVEGVWQFQRETLRQSRVVHRSGGRGTMAEALEYLLDDLTGGNPTEEELEDFLAALADDVEAPMIGDDPKEPPPATTAERHRLLDLVEQLARRPDSEPLIEDRAWLETTPQTLPLLTTLLIDAMAARPRDERRIAACLDLVTLQLEFVRYRLDRGWEWASRMLNEYQQRLIALGNAGTIEQTDWFAMAAALTQARVPVTDAIQTALAGAGMTIADPGPPEEMMAALHGLSDELAGMVDSPFEVIEALSAAGAVMPAALRSFMTTELALSPHAVLREAVPMMLLDNDSTVRRAAAAAMEQIASADRITPDWLRRAITLRSWIPQADRPELDRAIRKARAAGVPIGAWPGFSGGTSPGGDIAVHASMVDGSGAQSILAVTRIGRKGLVAGLLLKHGVGVLDAWLDPDVTRANINKMLRGMKGEVPSDEVNRSYLDTAVQHAIAVGLTHGTVPGEKVLAIAEAIGSSEWRDRRLEVTAEADCLFEALPPENRTPAAIAAALARGATWVQREPIAASWFEDDQAVRQVVAKVPRRDTAGAIRLVLTEILAASRMAWAERFLLMALWCKAAISKAYQDWASDFIVLTHALTSGEELDTIPIMTAIATQTVMAARTSGW